MPYSERVGADVLQVIHPACLSAIRIHGLRIWPDGELEIDGRCESCDKYVQLIVPAKTQLREPPGEHAHTTPYKQRVHAFERDLLRGALKNSSGNQAKAAKHLGLSRSTFAQAVRRLKL